MTHRLIKNGELILYGPVGLVSFFDDDGFTSSEVIAALAEIDGDVFVRLNSGGGIAMDGIAIYNAMKARETKVTVAVDAIAASAASVIAMAGDDIIMRDGALMMIHDASGITIGTEADHTKQAEVLNKLDGELARIYARRTGKTTAAVRKMMDDETWFDGKEAVEAGFATQTDDAAADEPTAFDYGVYAHAPSKLVAKATDVMTARATRKPKAKAEPSPKPQETTMEMKDVTAAMLRQQRPDLITEVEAAHDVSAKVAEAKTAGVGDGAKAERDRILAIQNAAFPGQEQLVATLITEGKSAGDAALALNADHRAKGAHLEAIVGQDRQLGTLGAAPHAGGDPAPKAEAAMSEDELKANYQASEELKAEFPTVGAYLGFVKGTKDGRLRILKSKAA